ncbi:hypothetical protein EGK75_10285 [Neisseria weixii]|uniref:Adhesin n=1 Tax=Neisseria weixii TaxID=1853276 RepID=A0A3N4MSV5_9NEIS|nr:hypothetical protein [Neisseria weixii]RPD84837.1 hypothetical protein EGK74_10415 [Neisseria weixii]RPD85671.1 hypothetical protein EGK75_10285 [Neisseria weixii]
MKTKLFCLCILGCLSGTAQAEYYKLTVKKISSNLYATSAGVFIQTKYCYAGSSFEEEAILKYEKYSYDNELIFIESNDKCDVEKVFR